MPNYKLKDKQVPGFNNLVAQKRHLLLYEPGLGKTVVCSNALYFARPRTVLIVCPKNAIKVWENHLIEWFNGLDEANGRTSPEDEIVYAIWRWRKKSNNPQARKALWRSRDKEAHINVYIITYGSFIQDYAEFTNRGIKCVILDEARRIRNRKSAAFKKLVPICKDAEFVWPLTGTPGFKPEHFWTMLHLCDPKYFGSYWNFIGAFYITTPGAFGGREIVAFKNRDAWFDLLRRKASILTKKEIGHEETTRTARYVQLDDCQQRLYKQYAEDMYAVVGDRIDIAQTSLVQVVRYRQLLICPKILDPSLSIGAALEDLVETFKEEEANPQCVIFCPFTDALPHFAKYLAEQGYPGVQILEGNLDPDEQESRINAWRRSRVPILCSIMYAQAFSLEPAAECYFIGREWTPDDNKQAEERLNRLTTDYPVTAYYYIYEDTYDEVQMQILDTKQRQENMIRNKVLVDPNLTKDAQDIPTC